MKLTFTKKLLLEEVLEKEDRRILKFRSYLKEDFVERALHLFIKNNGILSEAFFSSNKYGTAEWQNGRGIISAHRWEKEDDLDSMSVLVQRYPTLLLDGHVSDDFALDMIIPDVLEHLLDEELSKAVSAIVKRKSSKKKPSWESFIENYMRLNEDFIQEQYQKR